MMRPQMAPRWMWRRENSAISRADAPRVHGELPIVACRVHGAQGASEPVLGGGKEGVG
jgi:hypothetical protein